MSNLIGKVVAMRYGTEKRDESGNGLMYVYAYSNEPVYYGVRADGEKSEWNESLCREANPEEVARFIETMRNDLRAAHETIKELRKQVESND